MTFSIPHTKCYIKERSIILINFTQFAEQIADNLALPCTMHTVGSDRKENWYSVCYLTLILLKTKKMFSNNALKKMYNLLCFKFSN